MHQHPTGWPVVCQVGEQRAGAGMKKRQKARSPALSDQQQLRPNEERCFRELIKAEATMNALKLGSWR